MSYSDAMLAYTTVLYLAFFGMVAFRPAGQPSAASSP
jgi:hypothetical protein